MTADHSAFDDVVGFLLEPVAVHAEHFDQLVTFSGVHDLEPGHEA